jgi:hypothetical protein
MSKRLPADVRKLMLMHCAVCVVPALKSDTSGQNLAALTLRNDASPISEPLILANMFFKADRENLPHPSIPSIPSRRARFAGRSIACNAKLYKHWA